MAATEPLSLVPYWVPGSEAPSVIGIAVQLFLIGAYPVGNFNLVELAKRRSITMFSQTRVFRTA